MPHYLIQTGYTPEAWKALLDKPEDRKEAIRPVVEKKRGYWTLFFVARGN